MQFISTLTRARQGLLKQYFILKAQFELKKSSYVRLKYIGAIYFLIL